jgi:hypothetical protein
MVDKPYNHAIMNYNGETAMFTVTCKYNDTVVFTQVFADLDQVQQQIDAIGRKYDHCNIQVKKVVDNR